MKKIVFFLFLFFVSRVVFSQQNYVHFTVKDGLPQMQCMKIFQDSNGYIWITTKGGVSKYDGVTFKNYSLNEGLPSNRIFDIKEDYNQRIWVFTQEGVSLLKENRFIFYPPKDNTLKFNINTTSFLVDKQNQIWFLNHTNQQLIVFKNGIYKVVLDVKDDLSKYIRNLSYDKNKEVIYFKEYQNSKKKYFTINPYSLKVNHFQTSFNYLNPQEKIVIKTIQMPTKKVRKVLYKTTKKDTIKIAQNNQGFPHLKRINDTTVIYTSFNNPTKMPLYYLIKGKLQEKPSYFPQINDFLQDTEKNIWVASEKGLYKITPFKNFSEKDRMPDYVWSIQEDTQKNIWFASYGSSFLSYFNENNIKKYPKKLEGSGFFLGALQLQNGDLLFSHRNGLMHYNGTSFYLEKLPNYAVPFALFEDTEMHEIYLGTNKGLYLKKGKNIQKHKSFAKNHSETILQFAKNNKGELWYVSKNSFGKIASNQKIENTQIKGSTSLFTDAKGNLWIGAENGLFFYDYKNIIAIKHPELNRLITAIAATDKHHFVFGGLRGIGILNIDAFYKIYQKNTKIAKINANSFVNYYTQSHGFLGEEVGQNGIFKDSKGRIWIPTNNNVVQFHPKDLKTNKKAPFTHITSFKSSKDNISWQQQKDSISELKHTQKNIRFDFVGISHTAPDMVTYKYRLKGFSDLWRTETKERYVTFTNLSPGNYTFELLARNNNGVWNKTPVTKSFTIVPALWQAEWFQVLSVLLFIYLLYVIIHYFYIRNRKKIELENELNRLQQQSIQSQLYPHLLFNAVSATGAVIYKENKEKAYDFVVKLSQFMRNALGDAQKLYKTIDEEMNFVDSYLQIQKIRFSKRFDYEVTIDKNVDRSFQIPQMLIQTYVENAVKHGLEPLKKGGLLKVTITEEKNTLKISIEDNGIGIQKAHQSPLKGTGSGIRIMNEIFELHNQKHNSKITYTLIDLYKKGKKGTISLIEIYKK